MRMNNQCFYNTFNLSRIFVHRRGFIACSPPSTVINERTLITNIPSDRPSVRLSARSSEQTEFAGA